MHPLQTDVSYRNMLYHQSQNYIIWKFINQKTKLKPVIEKLLNSSLTWATNTTLSRGESSGAYTSYTPWSNCGELSFTSSTVMLTDVKAILDIPCKIENNTIYVYDTANYSKYANIRHVATSYIYLHYASNTDRLKYWGWNRVWDVEHMYRQQAVSKNRQTNQWCCSLIIIISVISCISRAVSFHRHK